MITATGIIGIRTNDKIEFNPQRDLLGRADGFPLFDRHRQQGRGMHRRILAAV